MENLNIHITKSVFKNKIVYIGLFIAFVIMLMCFPNEGKFKYDYHKGRPWLYETLTAPIDFPILKTQAELLEERDKAASEIIPYYVYDASVLHDQYQILSKKKNTLSINEELADAIADNFKKVYQDGVMPDRVAGAQGKTQDIGSTGYIILQRGKRAVETAESELYTQSEALRYIRSELLANFPQYNADSILTLLDMQGLIIPNLTYDPATTILLHKEAIDYISPTKGMIYTGQLIVSEGETVTAEIEQLLDSYKAEYQLSMGYSGSVWRLILGHAIFVLIILSLLYVTIYFVDIDILKKSNQFCFILFVVTLAFVITVLVRNISTTSLFCMPFAVFVLYMMAFFHAKLVFPIYMIMLLPLLFMAEHGVELYTLNVFAGAVTLVSFSYLYRGWLQFMNSLLIFVGLMLVHIAFELIEGSTLRELELRIMFYLFLNALFVVAAYPLVSLLEKIFSLVSVATLKDLSDTNNSLLQELARKAPGTFQHSLQVANLAERAAAAIGGNARLVKVGAMYHDVGKLSNPQCFIENQAPGINYHEDLSPMESAREIIKHVEAGVELAKKYHLHQVVIDFITSHHGCSQTGYFYTKYCNEGGDPSKIGEFTYKGTLPTSKEQVVVMMADAVEAASRSLKDYSAESISKLVDGILSQRMSDSQLVRADISIKEINIVKVIFKKHLGEIYHARIAYPHKKN